MGRLGFLVKFWDYATFFLLNIFVEIANKIQVMYIQVVHMSMFFCQFAQMSLDLI